MKNRLILSLGVGAIFTLGAVIVLHLAAPSFAWLGAVAGAVFSGLLFLILTIGAARTDVYFHAAEQELLSGYETSKEANFRIDGKVQNGRLYLCSDEIVILLLNGKRYQKLTIPYAEIVSVDAPMDWKLTIRLEAGVIEASGTGMQKLADRINEHLQRAWRHVATGPDGNTELFGVNIFAHPWEDTGKKVSVTDPIDGLNHFASVFRTEINGTEQAFVALEISNGVWCFFVKF